MEDQRTIINGQLVDAIEDSDPDLARAFQDFREALEADEGSTGWMKVYRIPVDMYGNPVSRGKNRSELFNFPWGTMQPDDVVDRVRQKFMRRGESRITIQITGGKTGERGIKLNRFITIERENEAEVKEKDTLSDVMEIMREAKRDSDERMERMLAALTVNRAPATDPMEQMVKMMTVVGGFMGMMAQGARGPAPGAMAPSDPFDQMQKMMGLMTSVKAFTASDTPALSGPTGDSESMGGMLSSVAVIAKSLAPMFASRPGAANPAAPAKPATRAQRVTQKKMGAASVPGSPNALEAMTPMQPMNGISNDANANAGFENNSGSEILTNNSAKSAEQIEMDSDMKIISENLIIILSMKDAGQTPAAVAKLAVDATPEDGHDRLFDLASDDDFVANMTAYNARVSENDISKQWFEDFADEVLTLLDVE